MPVLYILFLYTARILRITPPKGPPRTTNLMLSLLLNPSMAPPRHPVAGWPLSGPKRGRAFRRIRADDARCLIGPKAGDLTKKHSEFTG